MTAALSIALLIAILALLIAAGRRRRFATVLTARADAAERLAEGARDGSATPPPREHHPGIDLDAELARLGRAIERLVVSSAQEVAAVESERRKLEEILAGVPEGVLVTTHDRVPTYANLAFRELFDLDRGASTAELLALVRRPKVYEALSRATAGEVSPPIELVVGSREISVVARELEGEAASSSAPRSSDPSGVLNSTPSRILLMARDVTEANRVNRMRRDFVANLSHEIKTPLAVIRGAAETLEESGPDDPAATEHFVGRIIQQIYRLEDLLKDLLTLSRLESPEASQHRQSVDLAAMSRRAIEVLQPLAAREGVELRSSIAAAPTVFGDAKALERMVLNLLVNAIQYNRRGGHVSLRVSTGSAESGQPLVLEVADDGIGIAKAELDRIFERFYRVDKGRGRAEGGSGLGLAIVKHVAQWHGGTVDVESEVDRGSVFRVALPLHAPPAAGADAHDAEATTTRATAARPTTTAR